MIKGTMKADAVTVGEINISLLSGLTMKVRAAFVNTKGGTTHGWTEAVNWPWSKATLSALAAFKSAIEEDLAREHLVGYSVETEEGTPATKSSREADGLGEYLAREDKSRDAEDA